MAVSPAPAGVGSACRPSTGGRSVVSRRGTMTPSARGAPPQKAGRGTETRRGSRWSHPGTPWDGLAQRCIVHGPYVGPPCRGGPAYHRPSTVIHSPIPVPDMDRSGVDHGGRARSGGCAGASWDAAAVGGVTQEELPRCAWLPTPPGHLVAAHPPTRRAL
jgi:hypothetical protein